MITTSSKYNFTEAENEFFSWNYWDGTSGNILTYKSDGRQIYHMHWLDEQGKMSERVVGEIKEQACLFWDELTALQENPDLYTGAEAAKIEELNMIADEPQHGVNGYCRKCHSYCYGDCEAN